MSFFSLLTLALRQSWREARSSELYTLFFALLIAVASSSTIAGFAERLHLAMQDRAGEFLGADLVISGSLPATAEQLQPGLLLGLQTAQTLEFATMLASSEGMQLSGIKAVQSPYPLRGQLGSSTQLHGGEVLGGIPAPGEVWLDAQLFSMLGIQPGELVEIGSAELRASRVLTHEPDRSAGMGAFNPRAMMNLQDLHATGAIQPGSRVRYRQLWSGNADDLHDYQQQVEPLLAAQQRIETLEDGNQQVHTALQRARQYLGLASLAAILLASVSIALSASNFSSKRHDQAALLRCFGLSRRQTLAFFLMQLLLIGLLASLLGLLLGWLAQQVLFTLLAGLLPASIPAAGRQPALTAFLTGLVSLLGFALPPLIGLGRIPPLRVLRRDLQPVPASAWLVYGLALGALSLIMWRLSLDILLTLALLVGGLLFSAILGALVFFLLKRLAGLLAGRNLAWRLGLGQLLQQPLLAISQILAFALILLAMALVVLLRSELLDNWQQQLPDEAANHFAFNILPHEKDSFATQLAQISPNIASFYPMTPGRLTHINKEPVMQRLPEGSRAIQTMQRDLNLTWSAQLPENNRITAGRWWGTDGTSQLEISVEHELAERLSLSLGDQVSFNIAGQQVAARVTSLRSVDWGSMQPNFFVIFSPGFLQQVPYTWITSFYLPSGQEAALRQLNRQHPSVSLLRVEAILAQLRGIMQQVSLAVEFVLLFVLAAGIAVLLAGVQSTLASRIHLAALLRALGTRTGLLRQISLYEFSTLGLSSGLLAWLGCELCSLLLYQLVFDLPWRPHAWLLLLPLLGTVLINLAGLAGTRRASRSSPTTILRGQV